MKIIEHKTFAAPRPPSSAIIDKFLVTGPGGPDRSVLVKLRGGTDNQLYLAFPIFDDRGLSTTHVDVLRLFTDSSHPSCKSYFAHQCVDGYELTPEGTRVSVTFEQT